MRRQNSSKKSILIGMNPNAKVLYNFSHVVNPTASMAVDPSGSTLFRTVANSASKFSNKGESRLNPLESSMQKGGDETVMQSRYIGDNTLSV